MSSSTIQNSIAPLFDRYSAPSRRRDPSQQSWKHDNLLFICVTRDYQRITFAHFRGDSAAKAKLSTFGWTAGSAYLRTLFEFNLPHLRWPKDNGADPTAWIAQWAKAFDKEPLTKEFFKRFDAVIDVAKRDLEKFQKLPAAQAYSRAQLLIERLLFLYFLQNRGWLNQHRTYLLTHFQEHRGQKSAFTYYEDFLEKLFFTLATPSNYSGPGSGRVWTGYHFLTAAFSTTTSLLKRPRERRTTHLSASAMKPSPSSSTICSKPLISPCARTRRLTRTWPLSLIVDYDLGVDPLQAERTQFLAAIKSISQLPNLEMNFRRGDSLLDTISGIPVRVEGGVVTRYRSQVESIQKRGHELHKARKAEKKKELRLEILRQRLSLAESVLHDQISDIDKQEAATANWFGETKSESEKRRQLAAARESLKQALAKIEADRKEREKLAKSPLATDFYPRLRKLEGADFDSPFNFVWNIDYAEIFTPKPIATLTGDMAFVNEVQKQADLLLAEKSEVRAPQAKGGFDLVVGNPPFVTARNPTKRELYRERWAGVCHKKYLLVAPFFAVSFGLLRPKGQLGFIVSNAFAKREFGQPLVEKFFPAVTLQKIIDCSGLMFPGHGTPTSIVFGGPDKPDEKSPILVAASLPGGGDLRTPPEESPFWHTLAREHENPGYADNRVAVSSRDRGEFAKWPWNWTPAPSQQREPLRFQRMED